MQSVDFSLRFQRQRNSSYTVEAECNLTGTHQPKAKINITTSGFGVLIESLPRIYHGDLNHNELVKLGEILFRTVMMGEIGTQYNYARNKARENHQALRVVIKYDGTKPDTIQEIPWELMHDGKDFIALRESTPIIRYHLLPRPVQSVTTDKSIRVLITTANPSGHPHLDFEQEIKDIRAICDQFGVQVRVKRNLSVSELRTTLRTAYNDGNESKFDIWHHCGHGHVWQDKSEFALVLEGEKRYITNTEIGRILQDFPQLKLTILNICFAGVPYGLASYLAMLDCPAVIGHRGLLSNKRAYSFARALYSQLFTSSIEQSVAFARIKMESETTKTPDWMLPICYLRTQNSYLVASPTKSASIPKPSDPSPSNPTNPAGIYVNAKNIRTKRTVIIESAGDGHHPTGSNHISFNPDLLETEELLVIGSLQISVKDAMAAWQKIQTEIEK